MVDQALQVDPVYVRICTVCEVYGSPDVACRTHVTVACASLFRVPTTLVGAAGAP
jgi:hypothetical protein